MSKSVSNDALWEKLSEITEQLKGSKQAENAPDFSGVKDEIIAEIERQATKLGKHYDLNFEASKENWTVANENMTKIFNVVSRIRKQQKETAEQQLETQAKRQSGIFQLPILPNFEKPLS